MSKRKLKYVSGYCAPHALKYASGRTEASVLNICADNYFTPEHGMEEHEWQKAARELGIRLRRRNLKQAGLYRCKLKDFIKACPEGMFIIYTDAHLFVVDDGEVIDPLNDDPFLHRIVTGAWRVIEKD